MISELYNFLRKKQISIRVKERLTTTFILTIRKVRETYIIFIDASKESYRGVLMHEGNVIAHTSRQFHPHEKNYMIYDLKLKVIVHALKV